MLKQHTAEQHEKARRIPHCETVFRVEKSSWGLNVKNLIKKQQRNQNPGHYDGQENHFDDWEDQKQWLEGESGFEEHQNAVTDVWDDSCVSLNLPKLSLHVCLVSVSCLDAELVEWGEDRYEFDVATSLEMGFEAHVIVFGNGLFNSVPESDFLDQSIADGIVGEGKSDTAATDLIWGMQGTVHVVVGSDNYRDFHVVAGVNLSGLVDEWVSWVVIVIQMIFYLIEVAVRSPTVGVDNCDKDVIGVDHELGQLYLHVLDAPWNVWGFTFLLVEL